MGQWLKLGLWTFSLVYIYVNDFPCITDKDHAGIVRDRYKHPDVPFLYHGAASISNGQSFVRQWRLQSEQKVEEFGGA
jgi:hypothetical protein